MRLGDVINSPAVWIVLDLERAGCSVRLVDGAVEITPARLVTPELRAAIERHRDELKLLMRVQDAGVQARTEQFAQQYAAGSTAFLVLVDPVMSAGRCFSCGDDLERIRPGRCWRCSIAWRLAVGLPLRAAAGAPAQPEAA